MNESNLTASSDAAWISRSPEENQRLQHGITMVVVRSKSQENRDSSLGGISSFCERLLFVGVLDDQKRVPLWNRHSRVFAPSNSCLPVALSIVAFGHRYGSLVPVFWSEKRNQYIANEDDYIPGGNFAASYDSRIDGTVAEALGYPINGALPIHDRNETAERIRRAAANDFR